MSEIGEFFQKLFDHSYFPPRWYCGGWSQFHRWLFIVSDLAVWAACFALPIIILRYVSRKYDARFSKLYFLFVAFFIITGSFFLLDAVSFWYPFLRLNALVMAIMAVISWTIFIAMVRLWPLAMSVKTSEQMEQEIELRKKTEAQLQINNSLLSEAQQIAKMGHWQWDVIENTIEWSDTTLQLFGLVKSELPSMQMSYYQYLDKMHPEDRQYVNDRVIEAFDTRVFPKFYHRILLPDGQVRTMLARGEVITDENNNVINMIGTVQDITEQKNAEHELLLKSQRLEAINTELEKFTSIASHDLREPLRKILTFGSMLQRDFKDQLGDKGNMYINKITEVSTRMQKLIDEILDFSKLGTDKRSFERVKLNEVINQVLADMEVAIEKSQARVVVGGLPEIDGNPSQLGQLFQNLLGNSIKFGRPHLTPLITIKGDIITGNELPPEFVQHDDYDFSIIGNPEFDHKERYCKITFQDNGIGFDEMYLDKIFLIFQRLHDRSRFEGTGIGLAVCKKVVELHNGFITAYSKPGEGATFIIILPLGQHPSHLGLKSI